MKKTQNKIFVLALSGLLLTLLVGGSFLYATIVVKDNVSPEPIDYEGNDKNNDPIWRGPNNGAPNTVNVKLNDNFDDMMCPDTYTEKFGPTPATWGSSGNGGSSTVSG